MTVHPMTRKMVRLDIQETETLDQFIVIQMDLCLHYVKNGQKHHGMKPGRDLRHQ